MECVCSCKGRWAEEEVVGEFGEPIGHVFELNDGLWKRKMSIYPTASKIAACRSDVRVERLQLR